MTAFEAVISALAPFGYPVVPDRYEGENAHYITYNYSFDNGGNYGDDEPEYNVVGVQIHFYLPMNEDFLSIRNHMREALFDVGFTYPSIQIFTDYDMIEALKSTGETTREIAGMRQILFECEYTEDK